MDSFFSLHNDSHIKLSKDEDIMFHRVLSDAEAYAKIQIKPANCLICNSSKNKFCNSHSIPARCLRNIAENGTVKGINGLIKIPSVDEENGVNATGTFRLICKDCDDKIFKKYETFEKYPEKITEDEFLHQIVLKNYLKLYSKKSIDLIAFPKLQSDLNLPSMGIKDLLINDEKDKKDYLNLIHKTKKLLSKKTNNYYRILEYVRLPYTSPLAFQGSISLVTGFDKEIINNIYSNDKNTNMQDMHICIFPSENYTYVLVFLRKDFTRYNLFEKKFVKLSCSEKLRLLTYIVLIYSEEIYYSPKVQTEMENNCIIKAAESTTIASAALDSNEQIKNCVNLYDLNKFKDCPNILAEDYKLNSSNVV